MSDESKSSGTAAEAIHKKKIREHVVSMVPEDVPKYFTLGKGKKVHCKKDCGTVVRAYGDGKTPELTTVTQTEYEAEKCKTCVGHTEKN
mmetsp:Transcript_26074/g.24914  ORF Transcript_26074/g.24914 Transcript_26074/m.24914 type:complete len:89 (+) Transcript_26074:314-580(+)